MSLDDRRPTDREEQVGDAFAAFDHRSQQRINKFLVHVG